MKNVLVVMPFEERHKEYMEAIAKDCQFVYSSYTDVTQDQVDAADIIIGNVAPAMVAKAEHLQWIQLNSAGADPYCKPGIIKDGTTLTCAIGAYGLTVAEMMVSQTFMLCRKLDLYMRNQVEHNWKPEGRVTSIWNSTTLVIGLGDIGVAYAKRMKALGSHVIGIRRNTADKPDCVDEIYGFDQLDEVLPKADIVCMILPSTPQTQKLMNERRLALMKKGAYLINGGRGDAIDCMALNENLRSGERLGGAALDVTDPEPLPADHPLWDAPRCIITPHVAGQFYLQETFERIVRIIGENMALYLQGQEDEMKNQVDPVTGNCFKKHPGFE